MSTKSQTFFTDFIMALLLFTFTLIVYFGYTINIHSENTDDIELMIKDANSISNSLALSGYPQDWTAQTAIRYGIADTQRVNKSKVRMLKQISYKDQRSKFSTPYDYFAFFVNDAGEVLNINGVCGMGSPAVATSYAAKSAYYYSGLSRSEFKNFMENELGSDIYLNNFSTLASSLGNYSLVVMENPSVSSAALSAHRSEIENFVSRGNYLIITGELTSSSGDDLAGAAFFRKSGQALVDRNSTANVSDNYIEFQAGEGIVFSQAYYIQNLSTSRNFRTISYFSQDYGNAISRWNFGNGTAYFLSDSSAAADYTNFTDSAQSLIGSVIEGTCNPINISLMSKQKLVANERYLIYNSKIVKMILYLWK